VLYDDMTIRTRILQSLRAGNTLDDTADMAGISVTTLVDWRKRGREGDPLFAEFYLEMRAASAEFRATMMAVITASAKGFAVNERGETVKVGDGPDWRAASDWLSRRDWRNYDQRAVVGHETAKAARAADLQSLTNEQFQAQYIEILVHAAARSPEFRARALAALEPAGEREVTDGSE
jgi:hypothetical protein